jgi:cytochrome c oxidase assembly factor CtaG
MWLLAHGNADHSVGWVWDPSILIGLALLTAGYALVTGPLRRRMHWGVAVPLWQQAAFYAGTLAVFIALLSPLDRLADQYLFSAHMVQHILLIFIAPPLWLLGTPGGSLRWLIRRAGPIGRGWQWITQPIAAFAIFNGAMWAWHYPPAYDLALEHEAIHIFEHLVFMGVAVIGWWPVLSAPSRATRAPLIRVFYLVALMLSCTALAALITLAPNRLYTFYADKPVHWGLTPMEDQQLGGLAMWIPGNFIFMLAIIIIFYRWLDTPPVSSTTRSISVQGNNQ